MPDLGFTEVESVFDSGVCIKNAWMQIRTRFLKACASRQIGCGHKHERDQGNTIASFNPV
jgi:hypothetical protein